MQRASLQTQIQTTRKALALPKEPIKQASRILCQSYVYDLILRQSKQPTTRLPTRSTQREAPNQRCSADQIEGCFLQRFAREYIERWRPTIDRKNKFVKLTLARERFFLGKLFTRVEA
jgi:hypothetical protein